MVEAGRDVNHCSKLDHVRISVFLLLSETDGPCEGHDQSAGQQKQHRIGEQQEEKEMKIFLSIESQHTI